MILLPTLPLALLVRPGRVNAYWCDGCGCLFVIEDDGETVYFDRFAYAGENEPEHDCECHDTPGDIASTRRQSAA